jgi:hypothetical protein
MLSGIGQDFEFTGMDIVPHLIERHRQVSHGWALPPPVCHCVWMWVCVCAHACMRAVCVLCVSVILCVCVRVSE